MTLKPEDHALIARLMARQPNLMLRGHEGYYRHEDIIEAVQLIGRLAAAREESRPDPRPSPVGREEVRDRIARLVWFMALEEVDVTSALHPNNDAAWEHWRNESESAPSRACADAILALFYLADGWRPIDTAPKDGTEFIAWCPHPDYPSGGFVLADVLWDTRFGWFSPGDGICSPALWQPLPPPPGGQG